MKLIKLPNGECINPDFVIAIRKGFSDRVIIDFGIKPSGFEKGHIDSIIVDLPSLEACETLINSLTEEINGL